jgi:copper chaperone CopZ
MCMKNIWLAVLLLACSLQPKAQVTKATLTPGGITCSMCSKTIFEALKKMPVIESVKTNFKDESYAIVFKKEAIIDFDDINKTIVDAGYYITRLKVAMQFNNVAIQNDAQINTAGLQLHFVNVQDQVLNGEKVVTLLDKHFETEKEFKKYAALPCMNNGVSATCSTGSGTKVYHVTL